MGLRFKFNLLPSLQPEEKVLFVKKIYFSTCIAIPNYRWSFFLPPLMEQSLLVTNLRVLHITYICRILVQEFDQWYDTQSFSENTETIKKASVKNHNLFGPYLEIVSENTSSFWYRSKQARINLYMNNPEIPCKIIKQAMSENF